MAGGTVLIADDESAIRTGSTRRLPAPGYAPRANGQCRHALALGAAGEGDVVITDVVDARPRKPSTSFRASRSCGRLPIIVMTRRTR